MADRYQNRLFPAADDHDRGAYPDAAHKAESDPLAELARLIGQTDPFGNASKPQPPHPLQSRANVRPQPYQPPVEDDDAPPAGPPPWMQRARQEAAPPQQQPQMDYDEPEQDYQPRPVHPLHRYAAQQAQPAPEPVQAFDHDPEPAYQQAETYGEDQQYQGADYDPSRYDDALYGQLEASEQDLQRAPAYPDDPYAYQGYEEEPEPRRRTSGLMTVAAVLALAVVGTGGAFAYRTYVGSPRSGEPPIIKADNTPTKVIPAQADAPAKTPDRMATGDGTEKIVSREETPVDVNANTAGPRVVFPPLNANANPPPVSSVGTTTAPPPPITANGTLPNNEPRKIRTLSVKGDNPDGAPSQAQAPAPTKPPAAARAQAPRGNPASANASANQPMSLAPASQPEAPPTRMASTAPTASISSGGYLVQVSSQRNEADAQASYRALQNKFPGVLGGHSPVIKRADLGGKGVYYRAMVGPFGSPEEASQFCGSLKSAGGQCVVQRN
ncbi:SPOR domain-containing protein [Bradyrhizobium sp. ISRA443]|uniref:SPOR domain-containing protein n=1 Tax=unclassified Bradyrhizobium TaxID=2631580 RepID=UPI00247AFD0C|nr:MULTISPECIES: SPOR domain-containing protein [unclassified Bradyrhizobium]WGS02460.1 SPOR domain-containing protein [Bradyrhizobium sp. ISRA436]WGS09345.1 SPOR domain-containing protein [Bradyrhizobium sp. ISRA437]WGS16234.1 SPOR domain-containing protein [Bradyrhizobium sp. ISRA443]